MVTFALLNEQSLPFKDTDEVEAHFKTFLGLVKALQLKQIDKIRTDKDIKAFEVIEGIFFQQFLGQLRDRELKDRLRLFLANKTVKIESPFIFEAEEEGEQLLENEYFF